MNAVSELEEALAPLEHWSCNCHAASLALVKSGAIGEFARVARGWADGAYGMWHNSRCLRSFASADLARKPRRKAGLSSLQSQFWGPRGTAAVIGQHSWVVVGKDCYDRDARIIDPTLWSYRDDIEGIWTGTLKDGLHSPHGAGSIWNWGRPETGGGEPVELEFKTLPSADCRRFLDLLGPLDAHGWKMLAHAPVEGWPAAEILPAINDTVAEVVPIDLIGMLTDRNPGGLYLTESGAQ